MDGIWTLVVCLGVVVFAAPGLTQDSNRTQAHILCIDKSRLTCLTNTSFLPSSVRTLFLISGPEVLHAGTPTPLAVTVFTGFSGKVTAELANGDTRVAQTEDFQGGLTRILTLPPIPGSVTQNSLFNLTVRGHRSDSLLFTSTTTLSFNPKNVSTFIQTDRSRYQPGDTVRVRVVSVQLDKRPYKGKVDISVQDPSGNVIDRWESAGNLGIVLQEVSLSQTAPLGQWAITTTVNGVTDKKKITVEHHDRPRFEMLVKTPLRVLVGDDISGSVRALYPSGQPVQGRLTVSVTLAPDMYDAAPPDMLTQSKEIYGSTQFFFSKDQLQALHTSSGISSDSHVHVVACVTSNTTEFKVNKTVEVHLVQNPYQLMFHDFPPSLKPSLHFSTKLKISRYDKKPLSSQDLMYSAVVEVTQRKSTTNTEPTTETVPVPEDGNVHIKFKLQDQVEMLFIQVRFHSSEETLMVYNNYSSPSSSYIQISPINTLPAQIGSPLQIDVESTSEPTVLHFVVSSRGQVVAAGTKNSSSFSLTPTLSWLPEACITVYCILSDGEVTSDTACDSLCIYFPQLSLNWSSDKAQPGEQVSLTVTALEPRIQVGIVIMGTHDDDSPEDDQDLKVKQNRSFKLKSPRASTEPRLFYTLHHLQSPDLFFIGCRTNDASLVFTSQNTVDGCIFSNNNNKFMIVFVFFVSFTPQECDIRMLTNANLYEKNNSHGSKTGFAKGDVLLVEKYWSQWMDASESLLWLDTNISDKTWMSEKITVPDGVTSLGAVALVMSDNLGLGFTPVPQKLTVSKDFSLSLNVPSYLIRGEEIVLEVNIINHLERDIEVIVLLAQGKAFEFVLGDRGDVSVVNAQKLTLGSHVSASALFPIRPVALGEMEISVDAVCAEASDSLVWRVLVKPEGVEQSFSESLFLELVPESHNKSRSVSFSFPPDVVPGSQRAHVALVGDILALSFNNLDTLVQMPLGCGEQNMIHFAPSVYVLQYLDQSTLDDAEIRNKVLGYMMGGYQRQLSYQRDDGSFSAFGASDTSGSTWLTAFVLRCFLQAQPYMRVDQSVLTRAMTWLLKHQGPQGEFTEVGRLIHTEMQGGLDNGSVALTAYVLIALLEDQTYAERYSSNVSLAQKYLEDKVSSGVVSNYSLCLVTYALVLANSPMTKTVLSEIISRADNTDGVKMWISSAGLKSHDWQPHSAQIEMASYVLLALLRHGSLVEGISLLKWLSKQRNHLGGYGTTQDTVVALQALAYYAAFSGANAIDLRLDVSAPAPMFVSQFSINSTNYRISQIQEINAEKDLHLNIYMEGRGFATFQMNVFYNVESAAFSQNLLHTSDDEAFSLKVDVSEERGYNHMVLSICMRLKDSQVISHTGMAILDVGMLSGFRLSPGAATPTDLIRKVEILPEKVSLYLDSISKSEVCIGLPVIRHYKVAHVQDAVVQVYDYYEPTRKAVRTYNSDFLHNMDSCYFCGTNCDRCRPGVIITVSSPLSSHSLSSATYSLSCIFLGVTAFFIVA
ncbi:LOW QUALITY PROTEIN: CD109 antigen-like [Lates calcarifer]|uniref:LOW QUALITY PROTEIN: CD109 antigen-like n=1 Tax=Lates calcarifer TaxID=8187 RepID=A0AAJ8BKL7_LATCA|nr:LOW QUALITY PROTEIN: CD109 antigen-like [Lates calcarifer]